MLSSVVSLIWFCRPAPHFLPVRAGFLVDEPVAEFDRGVVNYLGLPIRKQVLVAAVRRNEAFRHGRAASDETNLSHRTYPVSCSPPISLARTRPVPFHSGRW